METNATYFVNDAERPLRYGPVQLINPPRRRKRNEPEKTGVEVVPVFCGFCGTDLELMRMGALHALGAKFPAGLDRLINGHEGVVWVEGERRFAIVLIRGGDSFDPTRFTEDETYFEYGCDGADGIFCDRAIIHPDMLLHLPPAYDGLQKLPLSLAKRLVFADPYACAIFQYERMCDIGEAQNFRVVRARQGGKEADARAKAKDATFRRTVIFGLGTTGLFIDDQIRRHHKDARIVFAARSPKNSKKARFAQKQLCAEYVCTDGLSEAQAASSLLETLGGTATVFVGAGGTQTESRVAFAHGVLGCNGIYDSFSLGPQISFDTMPFGFHNQVILSSINFTKAHMEEAIRILCGSRFGELVELLDKDAFLKDPIYAYKNQIFVRGAPLKTAVVWNEQYIDREK